MENKVRVGIIGTSWWTEMMFLPSFGSHPSAEIAAICGRNRKRAEEVANTWGVPQVFTDYRTLLEQGEIDAVVVATPDDLHYPMTMAALDAGLHVLCEKPMALNAHHAKEMYDKAQAAGVKHMVLFSWRWNPHFRYLKQLVDDGYIGRCYQAHFSFVGGHGRNGAYAWRFDGRRSNGIISDLGAHMIDFARWCVGDIRKVNANLTSFVEHASADQRPAVPTNDAAFVLLESDNGAQVAIQTSAVAHQADRSLGVAVRLQGEAGTLEVDLLFSGVEAGVVMRGARQDEEQFQILAVPEAFTQGLNVEDPMDPFFKQSVGPRLFIDAILQDRPIDPNFYDGWKVQEVIDAAVKSDREGRSVSLA